MKALFLSHSNGGGGAGRATQRLFDAIDTEQPSIDLRMHVDFKLGDDPRIFTNTGFQDTRLKSLRINAEEVPAYVTKHVNPQLFSPGFLSSTSARRIDNLEADLVNIHWTNFGYLSISQIGKIKTPIVWTLHDMWAFTGGMHYETESTEAGWRPSKHYSTRLDQRIKQHKLKAWKNQKITAVSPSNWLAELAKSSEIGSNWDIRVIPNPLDLHQFAPGNKDAARRSLGIAPEANLAVVSLGGDLTDSRKGFDLLNEAIRHYLTRWPEQPMELLVVGHDTPEGNSSILPDSITTHWLGKCNDEQIVEAYAAADIALVPSRQDNLPQTATEAIACGVPVIAFNAGGLPDIVHSKQTGYLADAKDSQDFALGIYTLLRDKNRLVELSKNAREHALTRWSPEVVAAQYAELFRSVCTTGGHQSASN